ncbi:hypothetical protein HUJ05_003008 [Dendroctonus ponderosae]|nr:hypothetical protein HUJ05_003008 [Dendroctonus ponderosae]
MNSHYYYLMFGSRALLRLVISTGCTNNFFVVRLGLFVACTKLEEKYTLLYFKRGSKLLMSKICNPEHWEVVHSLYSYFRYVYLNTSDHISVPSPFKAYQHIAPYCMTTV